jgi:hypothetical protein
MPRSLPIADGAAVLLIQAVLVLELCQRRSHADAGIERDLLDRLVVDQAASAVTQVRLLKRTH